MIKDSNTIFILRRPSVSSFMKANLRIQQEDPNMEGLSETTRKIGSAIKSVNTMLANGDELKALMPSMLGLSATSSNWDTSVKNYWDSLTVEVPNAGIPLEVGFNYDFDDNSKKEHIAKLAKENTSIKDDKSLMDFLKGSDKNNKPNVDENKKYLYATPIEPKDYLLWRYCLNYSRVANRFEEVDKSPNIAFYLYSKGEIEKLKKSKSDLEDKAYAEYIKLISDEKNVDNLLLTLGKDIIGMETTDKHLLLKDICRETPKLFIDTLNDKNLTLKAEIERLIHSNILMRLANSGIVTSVENPELVLGNNINEVISFFNNESKKQMVNEFRLRYKSINTTV